jgi:WD40 repeat protein
MLFTYSTGDNSSRMDLYDLSEKKVILSQDENNSNLHSYHFLGNGDSVIFLSSKIKIWDIKRNKVIQQPTPYFNTLFNFRVSPDEKQIAISGDRYIENFEGMGSSTRSLVAYASLAAMQKTIFEKEFDFSVSKLEFDAGGKILGANSGSTPEGGSFDEGTRVWDVLNGNPLTSWLRLKQEVDFDFDREGKKIILTCNNGTTEIWQVGEGGSFSGSSRRLWYLHDGNLAAKSVFSPDGNFILTVGEMIKVWKMPLPAALHYTFDEKQFAHQDTDADTSSRWYVIYVENADDSITNDPLAAYIYESSPERLIGILKHDKQVYRSEMSWGGKFIATATDNTVFIWDRASQRLLFKIPIPQSTAVNRMAFSPDNSKIAIVYTNLSFRVWDAANGVPLSPFIKHYPGFTETDDIWVWFSRKDGKMVASTDGLSEFMLWDVRTGDPLCAPVVLDRFVTEDSLKQSKLAYGKSNTPSRISSLSPENMKLYAELIANQQMDSGGSFVPIPNQEYLAKWEQWKTISGK